MTLFRRANSNRYSLPLLVGATALTAFLAASLKWIALLEHELYEKLVQKDDFGGGFVEHATVAVLVPGIAAGLWVVLRHWRRLPVPWLGFWIAAWTLACIYFAGEEISWGQWQVGWETPELMQAINDQRETNLHNMSSWLDQKPRALVEAFIVLAGLLVPVGLRGLCRRTGKPLCTWLSWLIAPSYCWAAAAFFLLVRLYSLFDHPGLMRLANSEIRELAIAWFLSLYLISYPVRLAEIARRPEPEGAGIGKAGA